MSELIALAWEDINLDKGIIRARRARVKGDFKLPKTQGSIRTIHLIRPAYETLSNQLNLSSQLSKREIKVTQSDNKTIKSEYVRFVFLNSKNLMPHFSEGTFRDRFFKTHLKKAEIRYRPPGQARHTYASQLLTAGVNERWIANQMGHQNIKMLEKHYGKWMESEAPNIIKSVEIALDL